MRRALLLATALSLGSALPSFAATFDELTPFLSSQYFTWREYREGRRLLRESGPLFSGGVTVGAVTDFGLTLRGKSEIFGGEMDYNGQTQAMNPVPVRTDVVYFGTREEFDLGYRFRYPSARIEPFAGIGYRWWLRDLHDSSSATGEPVSGYTESWQTAYGRFGARGRYETPSGLTLFAEGGAKYPFYTGNSVDFAFAGVTTFRPGGKWSAFGETGLLYRRVKVAVTYEGFRYSQSPLKVVGAARYFQPESSSDIVGLSLGWAFR
jgi:hypothetical protein